MKRPMKRIIATAALAVLTILPFTARTANARTKSTCDGILACFSDDACLDFITDATFDALLSYYNSNC